MVQYMTNRRLILRIGVFCLALVIATVILSFILHPAIDWSTYFRPAVLKLLTGHSPYEIVGFPSPPWMLLPIIPLALLPDNLSRAAWFVVSLAGFILAGYRLGARPIALAAFIGSPFIVHSLLNGNVDWIVLLGFSLPPQIGLFFVTVKPQMSSVVVLFWLVEAWRRNRWREVGRVFGPIVIATGLSFVLFGFWPLGWLIEPAQWWNASLWPVSIPIGLALAVAAVRIRRIQFAMCASPCLSPYVLFHAWAGALAGILAFTAETLAAVIGLWILVLIRAMG